MKLFEQKTVIITGAGSGVGRAAAQAFSTEGAQVVVADIKEKEGRETVEIIKAAGGEAVFVSADVSDAAAVQALVNTAIQQYGALHYAVNNAGLAQPSAPLADADLSLYERIFNVNVRGVWLGMKYEIPAILQSGGGAIVNVASAAGLTAFAGGATYSGSKHAVVGLTKGAALDYARQNLRVNAVGPGTIATPMIDEFIALSGSADVMKPLEAAHPMGRVATAEEVAQAILWLCSDKASFVTGHMLMVDGGYTVQ